MAINTHEEISIDRRLQLQFDEGGASFALKLDGTTILSGTAAGLNAAPIFGAGLRTKQAVNNVHDTAPTIAELTTSFGAPATLGRGFIGTVDDADGDTNCYLVWVSDASFYFVKGTKAA